MPRPIDVRFESSSGRVKPGDRLRVLTLAAVIATAGCASSSSRGSTASTSSSTPGTGSSGTSTVAGLKQAHWAKGVTIAYETGSFVFRSDGIPNHARQAEYAVPNDGVRVPSEATAHVTPDPTRAQNYAFTITTTPKKASATTSASLGGIGVMISGAVLFNPYEGDASTVALESNFTVKDSRGNSVAFLDSCNGHPTPMGQYHYHGLPRCITALVDGASGPSHIIGVAFDGFPIYGDRDLNGKTITANGLDHCNGISSATPEFPQGIYHYVLLDTPNAESSIRCFTGTPTTATNP